MSLGSFGNQKYNNGFTLAEVLITLVIIGIIAALTVPTIIQNSNESATVSQVKKGLSVLGQAKMLAENQNGPVADWDFPEGYDVSVSTKFFSYLKPHMSVIKDCGITGDCYQNPVYYLNGTTPTYYGTSAYYYKFVLSDGSVMWFRMATSGKCSVADGGVENACAIFFYDVNGSKAPNTVGRDVFLYVFGQSGVFPYMSSTPYCNKNSTGWSCAAHIMKTGNMNYLH